MMELYKIAAKGLVNRCDCVSVRSIDKKGNALYFYIISFFCMKSIMPVMVDPVLR